MLCGLSFFFFKQKTAYEMRISDWSSDVCSSDLQQGGGSMRGLPLDLGMIHFVGIGGIGMSGIAEVLANLGYQVQGSDMSDNANVQRLRKMGVQVALGHRAENLGEAQGVVVSSASKTGNQNGRASWRESVGQ